MLPCAAVACKPSEACRNATFSHLIEHGRELLPSSLGLKRLTLQLPRLVRCLPNKKEDVLLVDVGAGIHGLEKRWVMSAEHLHEDDSDSLWMLSSFKQKAHVHAFESNPEKAEELRQAARSRPATRSSASRLTVHAMGVGSRRGYSYVAQCGRPNTWTTRSTLRDVEGRNASLEPRKRCKTGARIKQIDLDTFSNEAGMLPLYVKVDVEGGEWSVLRGMMQLLRVGRPLVASFEYAVNWHPHFRLRKKLTVPERKEAYARSLQRFQKKLSTLHYDTYLILGGTTVSLVPVYGDFWRDEVEICANRALYYGSYGQWCWNDLLIVYRCNECVRTTLFDTILPATRQSVQKPRADAGLTRACGGCL